MAIKRLTSLDTDKATRLRKASMALETLAAVLRETKPDLLIEASSLLARMSHDTKLPGKGSPSADPNRDYLIGYLPRLFQDKDLFSQNEDIVDFASSALGLQMNRSEKRSRYEIIGKVICETDALDGRSLTNLVRALEKVLADDDTFRKVKARKKSGRFSWNETIQELIREG